MFAWTVKGKFAYLCLETLLEEKGIVRIMGSRGNYKEMIPLGLAKESIQKVCRGGSSRRKRVAGRWDGVG